MIRSSIVTGLLIGSCVAGAAACAGERAPGVSDPQHTPPSPTASADDGGAEPPAQADAAIGAEAASPAPADARAPEATDGGRQTGLIDVRPVETDYDALRPAEPVCPRGLSLGPSHAVGGIDGVVSFVAATADELTFVWFDGTALRVADRWRYDAEFEESAVVSLPSDVEPERGAALSANGMRLLVVLAEGMGFTELARAERMGDFDTELDRATYEAFETGAVYYGERYSDPIWGPGETTLCYASVFTQTADIRCTPRAAQGWGASSKMEPALFRTEMPGRRVPTALTADDLSLLFWDEAEQAAGIAWRLAPDLPFDEAELLDVTGATDATDVPDVPDATDVTDVTGRVMVNEACSRVYFNVGDTLAYSAVRAP